MYVWRREGEWIGSGRIGTFLERFIPVGGGGVGMIPTICMLYCIYVCCTVL